MLLLLTLALPSAEKSSARINGAFQTETEEPLAKKGMIYGSNKSTIDLLGDEGSSFHDRAKSSQVYVGCRERRIGHGSESSLGEAAE